MLKRHGLAATIGAAGGLVSLLFTLLLSEGVALTERFLGDNLHWLPILGGLLLLLLAWGPLASASEGFGVAPVRKEIDHINRYLLRPRETMLKAVGTLITLIAGFSVGLLGPIVYLGGFLGSTVAYRKDRPDQERRILIAAGVAALVTGVFNDVLFGLIFTFEVLLKGMNNEEKPPILLSALTSGVVVRFIVGEEKRILLGNAFVKRMDLSPLLLVTLALLAGLIAAAYIWTRDRWGQFFVEKKVGIKWRITWVTLITAVAVAFFPGILEYHGDTLQQVVAGRAGLTFLLVLLVLRFFLTTLSLGAGLYGGGFSPAITMGATLGAIVAVLFGFTGFTSAAVLGMVGMFAGFAHAPLTATVLAYTLTGAPILILPALFVSLVSYLVVERLLKRDFFHEKAEDDHPLLKYCSPTR